MNIKISQLRDELAKLYPLQAALKMLLDDCELSYNNIHITGSSKSGWHEVLKELNRHVFKIKILLDAVSEEYPDNIVVIKYLQQENNRIKAHQKKFAQEFSGNSPSQSEAIEDAFSGLIVHNSEYEKIIGKRNDLTPIAWVKNAARASRSVCKVLLQNGASGTGWIYNDRYLLTNNHVIENIDVARSAKIIFNYGGINDEPEKVYGLNPNDRFCSSPELELDFSLVAIADQDNSLAQFGSLTISKTIPRVNDLVNIIQHPKGDLMKMAMPDEVISVWPEKNYLFYKCDTLGGSSGSPVFNQNWEVVALHHAGRTNELQINQKGKKSGANRGILIGSIIDHISSN